MSGSPSAFANPAWWLATAQLAIVTSADDPDNKGRVQVQLHGADPDGEAKLWARVAVAFAGSNYGAFMLPDEGEEVLVVFSGGDVRYPVVVGALWTGADDMPDEFSGRRVDRWALCGKAGTRIAIVEESDGQAKVEIETPNGAKLTLNDGSGGEIELTVGTNTLTMDSGGVSIETSGEFSVQAASVSIQAGSCTVTSGSSDFSGATTSLSHTTSSIVSPSYTPGAGNVW
jgi:uncharacterized protein involved in type VI secretion and phage assembly